MTAFPELKSGTKYRVRYRIPGVQKRDREMVALYIGMEERVLYWSGRPQFGTTELPLNWVTSTPEEVSPLTECYGDRKV